MAAGREGDWECSGCKNRNYAFRSFCNRCKQPRLLVDNKTPSDSKWLPRIGDWICTGCTNNNYASREKCKKCGQPKEAAAMPATAMPGVFAGMPGLQQCMNMGILGSGTFQKSLSLGYSWPFRGSERYNAGVASALPLGGCNGSACPYTDNGSQLSVVPKGWRSGDWICNCGFHNYSSRTECKKCNAGPPGLKRLASEDLTPDWDNKRLNAGPAINQYMQTYPAPGQTSVPFDQELASYPGYLNARPAMPLNLQARMQLPQLVTTPTLIGKGAKQWRHGDWMCTTCNNHNYASRDQCNRCKTQRSAMSLPVDAA